jgi:hypothetical protein
MIPKPADLHPVITEKVNKRNIIQAKATAMKAECAMLRARLQNAPSNGNASDNRVREILGEAPLADTAPDVVRLDQLLRELQAVNSAVGILDHQIYNERIIGSKLVCESVPVKSEVTKRGKAFAQALIALHAAHTAYDAFLDEVENSGTNISSLNRIHLSRIGSPRDPSGAYHYSLMDFVDSKVISREELPKEIR